MDIEIIPGLLQNIAILLSFSLLYDYWWVKNERSKKIGEKLLLGLILGGIGIVLMLTPWTLYPGLVFDTRSIMLAIAGLFFGGIPTIIAIVISAAYRFSMGGDGMMMGVAVIVCSGMIGIIWNKTRPSWRTKQPIKELLLVGLIVHLAMLACTIFLPSETLFPTLKTIGIPLILIYTPGTMVLGLLMIKRSRNWATQRALYDSEEKYRLLYESMTDAHAIVDMDGNIIECNKIFKEMLGYSGQEKISKKYMDITPKKWHAYEDQIIKEQVLIDGSSGIYEKEYIHRNGSIFPVELRVFSIKDEQGNPIKMWAIVRDISARKKTEAELIMAKDKAEESDRLKSIFLANMSHEVRTPMNAIIGFSDLIKDPTIDKNELNDYVQIIINSGTRLLKIIDDILDISRIDSGQLPITIGDVNIYSLIEESVLSFQQNTELKKNPYLSLIGDMNKAYRNLSVKTDPQRLQQALDNLITNAIKFTKKGIIQVGMDVVGQAKNTMLEIYVKDTGIGIPYEKQKLIFERFRQADESGLIQGTGLGLTITKELIRLLGGEIILNSAPDKGAAFTMRLPFVKGGTQKSSSISPKFDFSTLIANKTLIIAEDDNHSYQLLKEIFRSTNAIILHAENGQRLMDLLEETIPDLILLDLNMPVKTGVQCLREIQERNINTKIIVQTAYAMPGEKEKYKHSGCQAYITKPIKRKELYIAIQEAFKAGE